MSENQIIGSDNNDILFDTILDDEIFALGGDNEIETSSGKDIIDGGDGNDQLIVNYSTSNEDLSFYLNSYFNGFSNDGLVDIYFPLTGNSNHINFNNIERFVFNSGSGNDFIDLGYDNFSDDVVNAGWGDDIIFSGLGNDNIDGGTGFDLLRLNYAQSETGIVSFLNDSDNGQYSDGINTVNFSNIEAVEIFGSNYDDVLVTVNNEIVDGTVVHPLNSIIDGQEGFDQLVTDYSEQTEDLIFILNNYGTGNGSLEINSLAYINNYSNRIDFNNIESFAINSSSGNDIIDLGYDNFSDDVVNAGGGNDFIATGIGNDTIDGGNGFDSLSLDFYYSEARVVSFLTNEGVQYSDGVNTISFSNIEAIEVFGSSHDDILVAVQGNISTETATYFPLNSMIDGDEGFDQLVTDYSERTEDFIFTLNNYGNASGLVNVNSYLSNYNSQIEFNSIESFVFNSGSGNDKINLGYDNYSDDEVNAGAGDDFIVASLGNDTINGGRGSDTFIYESGHGIDLISDSAGDNDTIIFGAGITVDNLNLDFDDGDLVFSFNDSAEDKLVLKNYVDSNDKIENIEIEGQILTIDEILALKSIPNVVNDLSGNDFIKAYLGEDEINGGAGYDVLMVDFYQSQAGIVSSLNDSYSGQYSDGINTLNFSNFEAVEVIGSNYDDVLVGLNGESIDGTATYPMNSMIDGGEGEDQLVADYSERTEDLMFMLNDYGSSGSVDVNSYMTNYYSHINFNNIESFLLNSGSGNDEINVGYDNFSNDVINAGAGDDFIATGFGNNTINAGAGNDFISPGLGNDNVNGGAGYDVLGLDYAQSQTGVVSSLTDSDSGQYSDGINTVNFSNIEAVEVIGSNYDDVLVALNGENIDGTAYTMNSMIDGGEGFDRLVADYSGRTEDLMFMLNDYGSSGSVDVNSYMTNYYSHINFTNIESFLLNSGSGNDNINLGYDNFSNDVVNAGAGDDFISAGLGNDIVNGGRGSDTFIYEQGHGIDVISDSAGDNDTIIFGAGITLDNLNLDFNDNDLIFNFNDFPSDQLIIENYANSVDSIENIQVEGQTLSLEEILPPVTIGEFGQVSNFNHNSQTIQLDNSYENPVVFALPLSRNDGDPAVVRITDIQNDNFTAYLQEAEYKDGAHANESFSYVVLENGTWELDNGSLLEVGTVDTSLVTTEGWETIDFNADFVDTPVILSQVQTNQESNFVRTRQNQASIDGFSLSMEEEDALKATGHATETVGWLAIDSGQGTWGELKYQAGHTGREVDHRGYDLNFSQDFANEPSLFASLASFYGRDASGLRYRNLSETQVEIIVEEDQSLDSETYHTKEIVDFLAISGTGDLNAFAYDSIDLS